jgi:hypothetical protein
MTATGWKGESFGVRVGTENAKAHFPQTWKTIGVEIDGMVHSFKLNATFWTSCPEFRGKEIKQWLSLHGMAPWPKGKPPALLLTPLGGNRFRLSAA